MLLNWALVFLVVALLAALVGLTVIAATAVAVAKLLFYLFLGLFLISLIAAWAHRA
jgi:uncharacterized membrane protein YtjA (UPF0391 family)